MAKWVVATCVLFQCHAVYKCVSNLHVQHYVDNHSYNEEIHTFQNMPNVGLSESLEFLEQNRKLSCFSIVATVFV